MLTLIHLEDCTKIIENLFSCIKDIPIKLFNPIDTLPRTVLTIHK